MRTRALLTAGATALLVGLVPAAAGAAALRGRWRPPSTSGWQPASQR